MLIVPLCGSPILSDLKIKIINMKNMAGIKSVTLEDVIRVFQENNEKLKNNITHNVVAKIEGTDPKLKDQYVVIGGHLDHMLSGANASR
jgi:hypothetical protein